MSDPSAQQIELEGQLLKLRPLFREPGYVDWSGAQEKALRTLLDVAKTQDANDPVRWVQDFTTTVPRTLKVTGESTYLGAVLAIARDHAANPNRRKGHARREF